MSAKLSELTQTARCEEELHLVEVKREPKQQQLAASSGNLEGAAAAAIAAVGPRAALAVIADHLMSICTFVAVQAAEIISGQTRHPLLTQSPAKKRKRPPGSKDMQSPEAVRVKTEGTEVKAEGTEVKAEETALQPLAPKLERAVAVTAVSEFFVNTPGRRVSACIGQLGQENEMLTCLFRKTWFCSHILLVRLAAKLVIHCIVSSGHQCHIKQKVLCGPINSLTFGKMQS